MQRKEEGDKATKGTATGSAGGVTGLKKGDSGPQVTTLQQALADLGYLPAKAVGGNFKDSTEKALKKFQNDKKLPDSGVLDPVTSDMLQLFHEAKKDPKNPGTRTLSAAEKTAAFGALAPSQVSSSSKIDKKKYKKDIEDLAIAEINKSETEFQKEETLHKDKKNLDNWSVIEGPIGAAQRAVDHLYGSYFTGNVVLTSAGGGLVDQFANEINENADKKTTSAMKDDKAREFAREWFDALSEGINHQYGVALSDPDVKAILSDVVEEFVHFKLQEMLHMFAIWRGSTNPKTGKIGFQRVKSTDPEENRLRMWDLFHTCIHEYLHRRAHKDFVSWAFSFQNVDDPRFNTLTEGFADFFAINVRKTLKPKEVQQAVEGPYGDRDPLKRKAPGPDPQTFPTANVEKLVSIAGIKNVQSAYFEGKTELIGGPATAPAKK